MGTDGQVGAPDGAAQRKRKPRRYTGELMDVDAVAATYGATAKAWRQRIARGQIPHLRLGGRVLVRRTSLERYLAALEAEAAS